MDRRITVRAVIIKNGTLFAQKLNANDGGERDFWCTPGGGLDDGESIYDGLVREMIEETGVRPEIGKLLYVQQYTESGREFMEFFFHVTNADDYETIDLAATTHGVMEVARYGFVNPGEERVLPDFFQHIDLNAIGSDDVRFFYYLNKETK